VVVDLPTVVLTAQAETRPSPMSTLGTILGGALGAMRSWEAAESVRAIAPIDEGPPRTLALDAARGDRIARIELSLKDARATLDLADVTTVEALRASIAVAYGEARAHPDDPEAGALVAEALRTLARVEALAGDADAASALRRRAWALDGGRLLGLSEGGDGATAPPAPVTLTMLLQGTPAGARVRIDGHAEPVAERMALSLAPGEHHLRIVLGGATEGIDGPAVHGSFFTVAETAGQIVPVYVGPPAAPCSARDLAPALVAVASNPSSTFSVSCPRWARVVRVADAAIEVRLCTTTTCGDKVGWVAPAATNGGNAKLPPGGSKSVWSSPWTYVAIGAAVVVTGGVAAWRLGAFDKGETPPPTWRWEGAGGR
jgi:hypothetical protein